MARYSRTLLALCLAGSGAAYKLIANCVPGSIAGTLEQTKGIIAAYTIALQVILPSVYGDLKLLAKGKEDECMAAANGINSNGVLLHDVLDKYDLKNVGMMKALEVAANDSAYLYVFDNKYYIDYEYIADCVPGGVVSGLEQTKGMVALYTIALQTILPSLFGDLVYLGQGDGDVCQGNQNSINEGNHTPLTDLTCKVKRGKGGVKTVCPTPEYPMKEVSIFGGLKVADNSTNYLYVFKNKMWNQTWSVMDGRL